MVSSIGGSGGVSAMQDMAEMRQKMFEKADSNSDGTVDKTELQSLLEEMKNKGGDGEETMGVDDLFSALDANGDGGIDIDEMDQMKELMPPPPPPPGGHAPPKPPGMEEDEEDSESLVDLLSSTSGYYEENAIEQYLGALQAVENGSETGEDWLS